MDHDIPIAFVTMVRDEPFFLPRWIAHYARHVPRSQLFILLDGADQAPVPQAQGCQVIALPRLPPSAGWDRNRWDLLGAFARTLLTRFEVVVVNDVDELIVPDPQAGEDLVTALLRARDLGVLSPFALEIVHRLDREPPFDPARPVLDQRRHARVNATYCKPCILSRPVHWSVGGHYSDFPTLNLDRTLYLFHLRFLDLDMLVRRQESRNRIVSAPGPEDAGPAARHKEVAGAGWKTSSGEMESFLRSFVEQGEPIDNDLDFGWQRKRIEKRWDWDDAQQVWKHPRLHNRRSYVIPDRFVGLF